MQSWCNVLDGRPIFLRTKLTWRSFRTLYFPAVHKKFRYEGTIFPETLFTYCIFRSKALNISAGVFLKCYYDQILDTYFLHFCTQQVFLRYLAKFQSTTNSITHVFWTFISENFRPPLIFLVPSLGWELEKLTSFSQKYHTGWNYNNN